MPSVGDVLAGRYRIDARLGSGGMATVFQARDLRLERDVAVKVLLPNLALDPVVSARFDHEARALAASAHPSIVSVFDVEPGDPDGGSEPFYVMELCDGGSLADRLSAERRLPPAEAAAIVGSIADGLTDLHGRGVIHRDVKPHNILFSGGRAKLADFGLARGGRPGEPTDLTAAGTTIGTLAWLAPELLGGAPATPASDVFALAVVAFQCLTGHSPRPADSVTAVVEASSRPALRVSDMAPELGMAFDGPIAAGLSADPTSRPTPEALANALLAAAARPAVPAERDVDPDADTMTSLAIPARPVEPARRVEPRRRSSALLTSLGLVALVVLGMMVGAAALRQSERNGAGASPSSPAQSSTEPSPTASPTPTIAASASPPPTPAPTPTPDPAATALAALDGVDAAIVDLSGPDGLKNRELNDLRRRAAELRVQLDDGRFDAAATDANRLAARVDDLDDQADEDLIDALRNAVAALIEAIPPG